MKYTLEKCYRWKVLTEDGLLKDPKDRWGFRHHIASQFDTREQAIREYARFVNEEIDVPSSMILVEEHNRDYNWDE